MGKKRDQQFHNQCGACEFFERYEPRESAGDCHADPPQVLGDEEGGIYSARPSVDDTDKACRHFKPRLSA